MTRSQHSLAALLDEYARPRLGQFGGGVGLLLAAVFLQRVPALIVGVALDALLLDHGAYALPLVPAAWIPGTSAGQAAFTVGVVAAAALAEALARWYGALVFERATLETLHEIRLAVYDAAVALPMAVHDDRDRGDVLGVVNDDVDELRDCFAGARDGVRYGGGLVSAFAFMVALNWQLAALLLVVPVGLVAMARVYARLLEPRYDRVRESVGGVNAVVRDAIDGLATVKAFTGEPTQRERVADASRSFRDAKWAAIRLRTGHDAASWLLGTAAIWGLFLVGGYWALAGPPAFFTASFSAGSLLTFLVYAQSFLDPTRRLAVNVVDRIENARAAGRRVAALLDETPQAPEAASARRQRDGDTEGADADDLDVTEGRVTFEDVTFTYPNADAPVVDGVSLAADRGDFVGVVGETGAGKSTLLALLLRFYDPDAGAVRVDGQRVTDAPPAAVREHVGYVSQDPFLFPGTVAENVAFGDDDPDRDAVRAAASAASAHEFVAALPDGYDTEVGERGANLSGGQRQRLALARALYRDPAVLVLDEATSHVDSETEAAIQRRLADAAGDRTVFAVAHRLSTVRAADRILVVEDGELTERGTHDELVERDGVYADLWHVQTGAVAAHATDAASPGDAAAPEVGE